MGKTQNIVIELAEVLSTSGETMATAESCTGGWIGQVCTDLPGSSAWFNGGIISYSNAAKQKLLAVPEQALIQQGAVSEAVASAMAEGALAALDADYSVAVTGIAGPDGGTEEKPVGTVWVAWCVSGRAPMATRFQFTGDRKQIRERTVAAALKGLLDLVKKNSQED